MKPSINKSRMGSGLLALFMGGAIHAQNFTWTHLAGGNASGSWASQANWTGGALPTTPAASALFNTLDLTTDSTVTLDGNVVVGSLVFGDLNSATPANWILNAGSPSTSTLTLGGSNPFITVTNLGAGNAAIVNAVIGGTNGLALTSAAGNYLQLNAANTYSGGTILTSPTANCSVSVGNRSALGTGLVTVGANPGEGQIWFQSVGNQTLANNFEIRTVRWIIGDATVHGVAAGNLTINGSVLLNNGTVNVRDIYCLANLTVNGNLTGATASNPLNVNGGGSLTLNGSNSVSAASSVNSGTLVVNGSMNGGASIAVNSGGVLVVNGTVDSASTVTVNSGGVLSGTGNVAGYLYVTNGGNLTPGNRSGGTLTCGRLISYAGANFNFSFGATNNPNNTLIKVGHGGSLVGSLNITDLGGFSSGVYTGLQYSGSVQLTNGVIAGGRTVLVDSTSKPGYVLFNVLNGTLNPAAGQKVPMDLAAPLPLGWVQVPGAVAYDVYLGTGSNAVATATTNTAGIYQGRTSSLTLNLASLQPNTTYYWRVDGVAANGTPATGTVYSFTTGAAIVDLMEDTWVATDALGRALPGIADCGSLRTNRPIGLFYFLWHKYAPGFGSGTNWDVSQWIGAHPFTDPHNPWADNPIFQTAKATYWWGQPELGYYDPSDPWMLRRQIALLNHAGIDVLIFDYSNAVTYDTQLYALCDMIRQMRFEGEKINLKIAFLTHANSGATATYLYNTLYSLNKYSDLWFYWQGKPLILGYVNGSGSGDIVPSATVQNFFTWRTSWANVAANALQDEWQWIDSTTPQNWGYASRADLPEQLPVSCGGWATSNLGHSYNNHSQPAYDDYHLPGTRTQGKGVFFAEEMNYGLKYDPQFLFITGWNEWIAGSFAANPAGSVSLLGNPCPLNGYYFVDEYNEEYSRDIEPMKGGHTDNYYFQMVGQNRLRKGVRPVPPASAPQTINLAGGFAQWNSVAPAYYDPANDTVWRNFPGASASQMGTYTNTTGRNDLTVMKVARDASNVYFFAQCNSNLTSYTGSNWMVLFIDSDQNHQTGWEGYDYAVNLGARTATTTTLSQNPTTSDAWNWTPVRSDIAYTVSGNQLMLTIPRASLGLGADPVQFDFKWADNFQTNDIADFGVDGDTAPDRRFNYRYITTTNTEVTLLADNFENGEQSVWGDTWTNGSLWSLTTASPYSGNTCAVGSYNSSGQSNLIVNGDFTSNAASYLTWPGYSNNGNPAAPTGWVVSSGTLGLNGAGTAATVFGPGTIPAGIDWAFIQNAGAMTQGLPTLAPGQAYQLTFQAASRAGNVASFVVTIGDGAATYVSSGTNVASNAGFQSYSYSFTAPATLSGTPFIQLQNVTPGTDNTVDFTAITLSVPSSAPTSLLAQVSTAGYGSMRLNFHYKLANVRNAQNLQISYLTTNGWVPIRQLSRDEFYPTSQAWSYDEQQNVWLNFTDTRYNTGPDERFFTTNFAFRIDASALTAAAQQVFIDAVNLTADTQMPATVSPQTWQTQDIGHAGNTGYVATNSNTFTVSGSGLDIWNNGDAFRFLYQTRSGDGTLTARVTGLTPTDPWAKAGVMIRESLDSGARNATMVLTANKGVAFQQRTMPLAATTSTMVGPSVALPYWVRVARAGTNFTGSVSPDGTNWTQIGMASIPGFNSTALWGLAVTAHNNTLTNVSTFDNVTSIQAPMIAAVTSQTLIAGQRLAITNTILNPDTPPLTLTWNLLSAPSGLTLDPVTGILNWRPTISQSPATNLISLSVTDSGTPPLSATQQFAVAVLRPLTPTISQAVVTNGSFSLLVSGDVGPDYTLLGATNLTPPVLWQPLLTNTPASLPAWLTDPSPPTNQEFFYRVLLKP